MPGGEADQHLAGAQVRGDLGEHLAHVLRLHHQGDGVGAGGCLGVGDHLDAVLLAELGGALGALLADHQVGGVVAAPDQAGEQGLAHHAGTDDRDGHGCPFLAVRPVPWPVYFWETSERRKNVRF